MRREKERQALNQLDKARVSPRRAISRASIARRPSPRSFSRLPGGANGLICIRNGERVIGCECARGRRGKCEKWKGIRGARASIKEGVSRAGKIIPTPSSPVLPPAAAGQVRSPRRSIGRSPPVISGIKTALLARSTYLRGRPPRVRLRSFPDLGVLPPALRRN